MRSANDRLKKLETALQAPDEGRELFKNVDVVGETERWLEQNVAMVKKTKRSMAEDKNYISFELMSIGEQELYPDKTPAQMAIFEAAKSRVAAMPQPGDFFLKRRAAWWAEYKRRKNLELKNLKTGACSPWPQADGN